MSPGARRSCCVVHVAVCCTASVARYYCDPFYTAAWLHVGRLHAHVGRLTPQWNGADGKTACLIASCCSGACPAVAIAPESRLMAGNVTESVGCRLLRRNARGAMRESFIRANKGTNGHTMRRQIVFRQNSVARRWPVGISFRRTFTSPRVAPPCNATLPALNTSGPLCTFRLMVPTQSFSVSELAVDGNLAMPATKPRRVRIVARSRRGSRRGLASDACMSRSASREARTGCEAATAR